MRSSTPWRIDRMNSEGVDVVSDDGTLIDRQEFDHLPDDEIGAAIRRQAVDNQCFKVACVNAFHGSDIPTEKIPVGFVVELLARTQQLVDAKTRGEHLAACIKLRDVLKKVEGHD